MKVEDRLAADRKAARKAAETEPTRVYYKREIKEKEGEKSQISLYATDGIRLGSVFNCKVERDEDNFDIKYKIVRLVDEDTDLTVSVFWGAEEKL